MEQQDIIRSFENALYNIDELDRAILRAIRDVMNEHDLWELYHEGTYEEIVNPNGLLYVPEVDNDDSFLDREDINDFMRELLNITYREINVTLCEDGEQGMTFLYRVEPDIESLPYLSETDSTECLNNGLVCSVDPLTGRCTECDGSEV